MGASVALPLLDAMVPAMTARPVRRAASHTFRRGVRPQRGRFLADGSLTTEGAGLGHTDVETAGALPRATAGS